MLLIMLKEGVHPKIVSERLGHANIGITLDFYSHVLPQAQASFPDDISNICIMAKYNQYRRDKYAYDKSHAPVVIKAAQCISHDDGHRHKQKH